MPPLPIELVITPEKYTISSCGYDGQIGTGIPQWMINSIQSNINNSLVPMWTTVDQVNTDLATLETGVNQSIINVETENSSLNGLITTVASRVDGNTAAIVETLTTLATDYDTTATLDVKLASTYDNSTAYFNTNITTYANDIQANATSITSLVAAYNGIEVKITEFDDAFAGISTLWDGQGSPDIGQTQSLELDPSGNPGVFTEFIYVGGTLGPNSDGWLIGGTGDTAAWAAYSSKLITNPNGEITGWEFGDGTNASSEFKITADQVTFTQSSQFLSLLDDNVNYTDDYTADLAVIAANNAQATANSKITASQAAWAINNNSTLINGSKIVTGTVVAGSVAAENITGTKISGKHGYFDVTSVSGGFNAALIGHSGTSTTGVMGHSAAGYGVTGTGGGGVYGGVTGGGNGGTFIANAGYGVYASSSGYAVYASGNVKVTGDITANNKIYLGSGGAYLYKGSHAGNSTWPHMYIPGVGHFALNGTSS